MKQLLEFAQIGLPEFGRCGMQAIELLGMQLPVMIGSGTWEGSLLFAEGLEAALTEPAALLA